MTSSADDLLPGIEVRCSEVHGRGVFATRELRARQTIGDYSGQRYIDGDSHEDWDGGLTYLFGLSDGTTIDGAQGGNATRHINHACVPNVEAVEWRGPDEVLSVSIRALRRIRVGEELFLDYALVIAESEDPAGYPCECGHIACRKSMAAPARGARAVGDDSGAG